MRRRASAQVFSLLGHEEKFIHFITSCRSLLTVGWRHPWESGGWSPFKCHAGPHPLSRGFSGSQVCWRQTRRKRKRLEWNSFHFCQVPPELVPDFQATKCPKLPRKVYVFLNYDTSLFYILTCFLPTYLKSLSRWNLSKGYFDSDDFEF